MLLKFVPAALYFASQDEWIFFTYPLDYLGVRTDIDIECGGPSFRSSHPEMSPTGQYLTLV